MSEEVEYLKSSSLPSTVASPRSLQNKLDLPAHRVCRVNVHISTRVDGQHRPWARSQEGG